MWYNYLNISKLIIILLAGSDDKSRYTNFGPYGDTGFDIIEYNNLKALSDAIESDPNYCAILMEPIQGENGVI